MERYDYIIVGAGSAGCALASRLTEDPAVSVLLLEAGGRGRHPWIRIPIGYGKVFYDARFNWKYQTGPEPGLDGRQMYWPRGKGLGGSSAINAMVYVRGHPADYDAWAAEAPGWGWADVEPVFRRMENWQGQGNPERGTAGPLAVTDVSDRVHDLSRTYVDAAAQIGIPYNADYNTTRTNGTCYYQITTRGGVRACSARAYLDPARDRPNLTIVTDARATRIRLEDRTATGMDYRTPDGPRSACAGREVVLAAGAINTPQLLQVSGIGPGAVLREAGVDVVLDAPQVGRNLMDHLGVDHLFTAKVPSLNQILRPRAGKLLCGLQYLLTRTGPLAMSLNQAGGFVRLDGGDGPPDLQLYFSPLTYKRAPPGTRPLMSPDPFPAFRLGFSPCKSTSKGEVSIGSPDPMAAPRMVGNYLSTEEDRAMMIAGSRLVRRIAEAPALTSVIEREVDPGPDITTDAQLLQNARDDCWTVFHQCGTCRMGSDPDRSVVDPRLRVHGIAGLRVADASIFPQIPSGNTNAPAIMVGEKAADILRQDAQATGGTP